MQLTFSEEAPEDMTESWREPCEGRGGIGFEETGTVDGVEVFEGTGGVGSFLFTPLR